MPQLPPFPDRINETSARLVASGVVAMATTFLLVQWGWLLVVLAYGFAARVVSGPTFSPLAQLVTRGLTPGVERSFALESRHVAGPPKRFAQGIGLAFSSVAGLAWILGAPAVSFVVIAMLLAAATLEAAVGICLGCIVYNAIWGCADCGDIASRLRAATTETR